MGKAVKKEPIVSALEQYEGRFRTVVQAATAFEDHDNQGQKLLYVALEQVFAFGEEIRQDAPAFESFLEAHDKTLNKVTKENPYNALVELAFAGRSKSWLSEISNVLRLASELNIEEPLSQWLEVKGGVSGRYAEAVKFFARPASGKAASVRSSRLASITSQLQQARVVTEALPGVSLASGFHRSLLFSEAGETFLVHVSDANDQKVIEKYLLEVAGNATPSDHPLHLPHDEFNRVPVAGVTNIARLLEMLDAAAIAFIILTAEDEQKDGKMQARMNVIHEVGLFQGRLGFSRAVVMLEEGCEEFSNIQGLGQIRFPRGRIDAAFEEVRRVLERENLVGA